MNKNIKRLSDVRLLEIDMKEDGIKVSIALVVYNHEKYLRQAIESILMQEVDFVYEIVVGDDSSTDNSRDILLEYKEKYPNKFVLIFHEKNVGGTKNSYDIYVKARGKYMACLEGDDYWIDNRKLQKQVNFLEDNRDYLGVSHIIEARDLQGKYISRHPSSPKIVGKDATIDLFLEGYYFSSAATVYRNIFLEEHSDYSIYYKAHRHVGDLTFCMILLDKGKIKVIDEVMSVYRCRNVEGESNYNSITNVFEKYNDHIQLLNTINKHFEYKYDFTREYLERSTSVLLFSIKHGEFIKFYGTFKRIPSKIKVMVCVLLPYTTIKKVFLKCASLLKR